MVHEQAISHSNDDGEYEVVVVRCGELLTTRAEMFLDYEQYDEADGEFRLDYYFWVLRNQHRTVVVDTGFSVEGAVSRGRTLHIDPREALPRLGIFRDTECSLIITHAHYDHIGNLDYFNRANVLMALAEFDYWLGRQPGGRRTDPLVDDRDLDALSTVRDENRLRLLEKTEQIAPGVWALMGSGHTPGQIMVLVQTAEGPLLLTSDAVHFDEELRRTMPFKHMCDLEEAGATYQLINDLLADGTATIMVAGHEPEVMSRFPRTAGLEEHAVSIGASSEPIQHATKEARKKND
ncbi:N-acyl homoserine lactonase family protein [Pseudarthrobacter sp. NKDBFgelt]|uniref:N-acyl homoserine lactonase family protein n=1 Tax=Pseudarthrobacter sp. NKDBFgelt TaxID=3384443 RepID=UPI0038D36B0D